MLESEACFNCNLKQFPCLNSGNCSFSTGICSCPVGFGDRNCADPVCGSLATPFDQRKPRGNEKSCSCSDGWSGVNCNICSRDTSCNSFLPDSINGTCYRNLLPIHQNYIQCDVTSIFIFIHPLDLEIKKKLGSDRPAELSLSCNRDAGECNFQFWTAKKESFFCNLKECIYSTSSGSKTSALCQKVSCGCIPGRLLCGEDGTIDLQEWFSSEDGPKGPSSFDCDEPVNGTGHRICSFSESNMNQLISDFFGDPLISLDCNNAGECVHYSEIPGYTHPVTPSFSFAAITFMSFVAILIVLILFIVLSFSRDQNTASDSEHLMSQEEQEIQDQHLMTHHTPCVLTCKNIGYSIDKKVSIFSKYSLSRVSSGIFPNNSQAEEEIGLLQGSTPRDFNDLNSEKMTVLEGVTCIVKPGQVMAIMGGSGAGKTTLLDILARKNKQGNVTGDIRVNGNVMGNEEYRSVIGYVDQEDNLMDTLTVFETILNSALLRLPRKMSNENKKRRVTEVMIELNIMGIADRYIGSTGKRGISGGEKRRVSIACELVTSPGILFLDEPTSGLDAYNAYNVVECLVSLARNYKRSVIMTIHQPRSNIYALIDQLVLLANGRLVYSGPAQEEAILHFQMLGYECPLGFNLADYLVDLTMHAVKELKSPFPRWNKILRNDLSPSRLSIKDEQENALYTPKPIDVDFYQEKSSPVNSSDAKKNQNTLKLLDIATSSSVIVPIIKDRLSPGIEGAKLNQTQSGSHQIGSQLLMLITGFKSSQVSKSNESFIDDFCRSGSTIMPIPLSRNGSWIYFATSSNINRATWWTQFQILSGRTFKNLVRNPDLLKAQYIITVCVAILCGCLFWKVESNLSGFQNRLGVFFFICAFFGFQCLGSIQTFAQERLIFVKERANRYYSPITYFVSKIIFDMIPLRVVPPFILGLICYQMIGLKSESLVFLFKFLLILVLFNVTASAVCLAIGIFFKDVRIASLVATLIMLFEMLFGGLLLNKNTIPVALAWLNRLSFFNYAFEALAVNEINGLNLIEKKYGLNVEAPGALILTTFGLNSQNYWIDVKLLMITFVVSICASFIWLQVMVKEKR